MSFLPYVKMTLCLFEVPDTEETYELNVVALVRVLKELTSVEMVTRKLLRALMVQLEDR